MVREIINSYLFISQMNTFLSFESVKIISYICSIISEVVKLLHWFSIVLLMLVLFSNKGIAQCQINANFDDFETNGMSTTIQWQLLSSNDVICYSSDWKPSFFVNRDSLLNVRITGEMFMSASIGDDDFVGFVFGYKSPTIGTATNDNYFYLFDWKKVGQHAPEEYGGFLAMEGFSLCRASGLIPSDPISTHKYFWGHELGNNFIPLAEKYGNDLGWEYDTNYSFELVYTHKKIIIKIDDEEIFNIDGCFHPGLFGLYTFSNNGTVFRDIQIEQVYDISYSTDQDEYCEELPINFSFIDTACSYIPSSLASFEWDFGDGSSPEYDMLPTHSYFDPGPYDVELRITNTEGCTDTISRLIFIESKPQIQEQPEDQSCSVGDQLSFSIDALYAETYQWQYQRSDMNYWSKLENSGHYSGVNTANLKIYNVRPGFDQMKLRCVIDGKCSNPVTSQYARISITGVPVRAYLDPVEDEICTYDSTVLTLTLTEPYQIEKANLRLIFENDNIEFSGYTTYLQNMIFDVVSDSNYIDIGINVRKPSNLEQVVLASLNFKSIVGQSEKCDFSFDNEYTWFIDENLDTIFQYLYNSSIQLNHPFSTGFADSINICRGDELSLPSNYFSDVNWNTGENSNSIIPTDDGFYSVSYTDFNNCQSSDNFYIEIDELPMKPSSIDLSKEYYCSFDELVEFNVEGGNGNRLKFSIDNSVFIDSIDNTFDYTIVNPGKSFDLAASWINICGQSEEAKQYVEVKPEAVPSIRLISDHDGLGLGESITINAEISDGGVSPHLFWYLDDRMVQTGSWTAYTTNNLVESQVLKVIMHSNAPCILGTTSVSDELTIRLEPADEYYIPTLVTPNGDGVNDSFKVLFKDPDIEYFSLNIYDVRGRLLFSTKEINTEWIGKETLTFGGLEILTYLITYKPSNSLEQNISGKFLLKK